MNAFALVSLTQWSLKIYLLDKFQKFILLKDY